MWAGKSRFGSCGVIVCGHAWRGQFSPRLFVADYENSNAVIFVVDSADQARLSCKSGPNDSCGQCARCELHSLLKNESLASVTVIF